MWDIDFNLRGGTNTIKAQFPIHRGLSLHHFEFKRLVMKLRKTYLTARIRFLQEIDFDDSLISLFISSQCIRFLHFVSFWLYLTLVASVFSGSDGIQY